MNVVQKAVLKTDNKYLILLRSSGDPSNPGLWDFPGGKLEDDEDPIEGLKREVKEETGVEIKVFERKGKYNEVINGLSYIFVVYKAKDLSGNDITLSSEHTEFRWETRSEIMKLPLNPFMYKYFEEN